MFSGRYDHAIDNKGRVSIPVRFREALPEEGEALLYVTNFINFDNERCLVLYPPSAWEQLVGKIRQQPSFNRNVQQFQTFFIGGAHEVQVDGHGRILIPPKLRDFAKLGRDVTFSAMTDHFQLWNKSTLDRVLTSAEKSFADPKFLEDLGV